MKNDKIDIEFLKKKIEKRVLFILTQRSRGYKLNSIGEALGITRERVRQLEVRAKEELISIIEEDYWEEVNGLIKSNILSKELSLSLIDEDVWDLVIYSYKTKNKSIKSKMKYFKELDTLTYSLNHKKAKEVIDKVINSVDTVNREKLVRRMYDNLHDENIRITLKEAEDIFINRGFYVYGEFMTSKKLNKGESIKNEIKYNYPQGINISDEEEIEKLRYIIEDKYKIRLTEKSIIARIQYNLVLGGRATYVHPDHLQMPDCLEDDILTYINNMKLSKIPYSRLFEIFEDRLLKESTIDNPHALHGYLKKISEEGQPVLCIKFYACKPEIKNIESKYYYQKIVDYLLSLPEGASSKKIEDDLEEFDSSFFKYIPMHYPEIISIGRDKYFNIRSLNLTKNDINKLEDILLSLTENEINYTDRYIMYDHLKNEEEELFKKLQPIKSEKIVYYALRYYLGDKFFFSTPHIVKNYDGKIESFTVDDLNELIGK